MTLKEAETTPKPTVSVVIPSYNAASYIAATLESVLAQTYGSFEILVVDDRSKDDTGGVVEAIATRDPRVRLIRLERNFGGPAGPRNVGVGQAVGEWVAFLDADDIWHPDKLRLQLDVLDRSGAAFCSSEMVNFSDERELKFDPVSNVKTSKVSFLSQLIKPRTPTSSVLVRTELVRRHPFNESPLYKAREDMDCWLHCHEEIGHSVKIMHALIGYRISANQISGNKILMVKRHHYALKNYTFQSGRKLGSIAAGLFTATHFVIAYYYRSILKKL